MIVYILMQIFNMVMVGLNQIKQINKNFLTIISFCIVSFFLGFGYLNGSDWMAYQNSYENIIDKTYESGFFYYMFFFKSLGVNFEIFRFFSCFIDLLIIYSSAKHDTKYYLLFILLYFTEVLLFLELDGPMRQAKAIVLCIFSIRYIYKKKILKFYIIILIAILFHRTAILFLPVYFIQKIKFSWTKLVISLLIIHFFQNIFLLPILKFAAIITQKSLSYFDSIYSLPQNNNFILEIGRQLIYLLPVYIIDKNKKFYKLKIRNLDIFFNLSCVFIIILNIALYFNIVGRAYLYFNYGIYILYTYIIYDSKQKNKIIIIFIVMIFSLKEYLMLEKWRKIDNYRYIPYTNYIVEIFNNNLLKYKEKTIRRKYEGSNNFWN